MDQKLNSPTNIKRNVKQTIRRITKCDLWSESGRANTLHPEY